MVVWETKIYNFYKLIPGHPHIKFPPLDPHKTYPTDRAHFLSLQRGEFPSVNDVKPNAVCWMDDRRPDFVKRSAHSRPAWMGFGEKVLFD